MIDPRTVPVRFSRLKLLAQSAAHYADACQDDREETLSMRLGSGVHALVLGTPVVVFDGVRRGKAWDAFSAEHAGELILSEREHADASAIADAVRRSTLASRIICGDGLVREQRIEWRWLGRHCAGTPDVVGPGFVADLKTTRDAEPGRFTRDAIRAGYHAQLAWYGLGLEQLGERRPDDLYVVAVENKRPHCVTVLRLTDEARAAGERLCIAWMERLAVAIEANHWGAYSESIVPLDVEQREFNVFIADEEIQL